MATSVGIVGLGKLGLPTAIAMSQNGYRTRGYDVDPYRMTLDRLPAYELDVDCTALLSARLAEDLPLRFCALAEVVNDSECVLVAVETPHGALHEGVTPLPLDRADFSYDRLTARYRRSPGSPGAQWRSA